MVSFYFVTFKRCNDPDVEDYGNKWSLGALLRYLKKQGKDVKGNHSLNLFSINGAFEPYVDISKSKVMLSLVSDYGS